MPWLTMLIVILLYDQLLFRPLLAWSRKFAGDQPGDEDYVRPWFLIVMQRARMFDLLQLLGRAASHAIDRAPCARMSRATAGQTDRGRGRRRASSGCSISRCWLWRLGGGLWLFRFIGASVPAARDRMGVRAWPDHRDPGLRADRAGLAVLGADRGMDRPASPPRRQGAAGCAIPRGVSGQSVLSARRSC